MSDSSPIARTLNPPEGPDQAPVWMAQAIEWAFERRATDLHFFPSEDEAMLWIRVDGELMEAARYPLACHTRMMARLKVLGRCSDYTGEPVQEGRFALNGRPASGEARLSILPTLRGEKAVVRLVAGGERLRKIGELGFSDELIDALRRALDRPQGLLLAVGPSGCGKSTALYALVHDLHARSGRPISTITLEDPVEQSLTGVAQVTIDSARGFGFAQSLRAILRQDPELIMVGEIRDAETATAALQASLTGHRLLSSMHTLSAAEAFLRLMQMGAAPYEISSALAGVLNLRLVRVLCAECKRERTLTGEELSEFPEAAEWNAQAVAEPAGCEACLGSGYRGRMSLGEWLVPTPATAEALQAHERAGAIGATLQAAVGARPAALALLREQKVSPAEFRRIAGLTTLARSGAQE